MDVRYRPAHRQPARDQGAASRRVPATHGGGHARLARVLPPLQTTANQANRLDLARWLVSPQNPLTPRVTVNQVWGKLFGEGLVKSSADFGVRGSKPTHPELLDWLARRFMDEGWSRKKLLKLIMMSGTYRQSSSMAQAQRASL